MAQFTTAIPPPTFGATGFISPSDSQILAGAQADLQTAFGGALIFNASDGSPVNATPQAQLASSTTALVSNTYAAFQYLSTQFDPAYAQGRYQDAIGRIYFMTRLPALPTTLNIACVGAAGTAIPAQAVINDTSGFQYICTNGGTIPASGSITLEFANTQVGPNPVPSSNDVAIVTAIQGWDSVTCSSGSVGQNVESRAQFETRREASVASNSQGPIGAMIGAVAAVTGVTDWFGYDNFTASSIVVNGQTIAANSAYICVAGSFINLAVGQAILSKKPPGCGLVGSTTVTAYDTNPLYASPVPYTINFQIAVGLPIFVNVSLVAGPNVPANAATQIQNQLTSMFGGAVPNVPRPRINGLLLSANFEAAINQLGSWVLIRDLTLNSINSPTVTGTGCSIASSVLTVGTASANNIAVGQQVMDGPGNIPGGVFIASQAGGTPGGAGTYNLTGASGLSVSSETMYFTAPARQLQVQANQEPSITASDVAVSAS